MDLTDFVPLPGFEYRYVIHRDGVVVDLCNAHGKTKALKANGRVAQVVLVHETGVRRTISMSTLIKAAFRAKPIPRAPKRYRRVVAPGHPPAMPPRKGDTVVIFRDHYFRNQHNA